MRFSAQIVNFGSIALLAMAQSLPAQQSAPPAHPFTHQLPLPETTVPTISIVTRAVVLDVVVVDAKNHPVKGLKMSDFRLFEDGVPQTLNSFEENNASTSTASITRKLPANTYTNYIAAPNSSVSTVILIDQLNIGIGARMYLHQQLVDYLKRVPPGTSLAIFALDDRMHLVQGFTADRQLLLDGINRHWATPSLTIYSGNNYASWMFRQDILTEGLQEIARYLSGFPGRKNLIWFTGPENVAPTASNTNSSARNPFNDKHVIEDGTSPDFDYSFSQIFQDDYNSIFNNGSGDPNQISDVLALSRVAVYPVDARGLKTRRGMDIDLENSFLEPIAEATGGKAFYNTNGLADVVAEVVHASSSYYTVSYTPTNNQWNGKFRHIKIVLSNRNFNLEYRRGYFAVDQAVQKQRNLAASLRNSYEKFIPAAETQPEKPLGVLISHDPDESLQAAMTLGAIPPTELIFAASITPSDNIRKADGEAALPPGNYLRPKFHSKPYRNYNLLYATDISKIGFISTPDGVRHNHLQFIAIVYSDQGDVVNSIISTASFDLSAPTYQRLARSGFTLSQRIAVPVKGRYFLRIGIHDTADDRVGAMELPVDKIKLGVIGADQSPPR
jgi:VWFA-related protein